MKLKPSCFSLLVVLLAASGCMSMPELGSAKARDLPPEFQGKKVGLYVHEKAEQFFQHGRGELDTADLTADHMAFHVEQVLPFNTQTMLQEIFDHVQMKEPGSEAEFKGPPLAGYFEVAIERVRYDYPDANRPRYRADVQMRAEYKTMDHERVWSQVFWGEGTGFEDPNIRLNRFARDASAALDGAFQDCLYEIQKGILESPTLLSHFRSRPASRQTREPAEPVTP